MNADQARTPPRERFAATVVPLDLEAAAASLAAESHQGQSGHRQIALYKSHHTTLALFVFESGGSMPEHTAEGLVIIQALKGRLWVRTRRAAGGHRRAGARPRARRAARRPRRGSEPHAAYRLPRADRMSSGAAVVDRGGGTRPGAGKPSPARSLRLVSCGGVAGTGGFSSAPCGWRHCDLDDLDHRLRQEGHGFVQLIGFPTEYGHVGASQRALGKLHIKVFVGEAPASIIPRFGIRTYRASNLLE